MENSHQPASRNGRRFNGQQSLNPAVKSICDIMRRSNCAGAFARPQGLRRPRTLPGVGRRERRAGPPLTQHPAPMAAA